MHKNRLYRLSATIDPDYPCTNDAPLEQPGGYDAEALKTLAAGFLFAAIASPALAAPACRNTGSFEAWVTQFKRDAIAQGISPEVVAEVSPELMFDPSVIKRDHGQAVFTRTFADFANRLLGGGRIPNGVNAIKKNHALFARIEKTYGVPPEVLAAVWGLESDYGAVFGKFKILPSLATLAYDCRRGDHFRAELMDALRIVERGDQTVATMTGNWAGEFGGMQFTPSNYIKYGVDFDGDRRVDLTNSVPDTLASAANYLNHRLEARRTLAAGSARARQDAVAGSRSRHLSSGVAMGSLGRARGARQVAGQHASRAHPADGTARPGLPGLSEFQGLHRLEFGLRLFDHGGLFRHAARRRAGDERGRRQEHRGAFPRADERVANALNKQGFEAGDADGKLGSGTREAVKKAQLKVGLPADSWPTAELLARLQGNR